MSVPRLVSVTRTAAAFLATLIWFLPTGWAQQPTPAVRTGFPDAPTNQAVSQNYSKPKPAFSLIGYYPPRTVPSANLENAPSLESLTKNGAIYLSLSDALAIALEDNLDIELARYNLPIADTDVLRSRGGGQPLGVAAGIVQGTPGGTGTGVSGGALTSTSSGSGGTSPGAGGAAAGTSGLVSSSAGAGPPPPQFDPNLVSTLQIQHQDLPQSTPFAGTPLLVQNTGTANFTYAQGFATGTNMNLSFNNSRLTGNNIFMFLSPQLNSNFQLTVTQHLLRGAGWGINKRFITISKNNREITDEAFRQQVMTTVMQIQDIYWDLVSAYEDLRVKTETLTLAERTLSDNKQQVELGSMAPVEITNAESQLATARQSVIVSQTNLQLQQLYMINALTRNFEGSPLRSAPVVPTDTMVVPQHEKVEPTRELIAEALQHRPELVQARVDLRNRQLNVKAAKNGLLPAVDLVGFYGAASLAGVGNPSVLCANSSLPAPFCQKTLAAATGYGTAFSNLFNSSAPDKGVALQMNLPIRDRQAQSLQVRAELETRQAQVRVQQLENQIAIQVRNAQFALQQNRAWVSAALESERYARELLEAEQTRLSLGASTSYLVLQKQIQLANSEENLLAARVAYVKSRANLDYALSRTLDRNGIRIPDAESGKVTQLPVTPEAAPTKRPFAPVSPEVPVMP
jgi:outer membrane protein TolC